MRLLSMKKSPICVTISIVRWYKVTDFCRVNNRTSPREGKSKRVVKLFTLSGRDGRGLFVYLCIRRTIKRDFNTINWNSIGINR